MSVITFLSSSLLWTAGMMILYAILFIPLERIFASVSQPVWRHGSLTDALYWFLLVPVNAAYTFVLARVASAFSFHRRTSSESWLFADHLPAWVQALLFAFAMDFIQYWFHRLLHEPRFWWIHEIHHSATELDWLSAYRRHPVEIWLARASTLLVAWFVISPSATAIFAFVSSVANFLPHANLRWTYGPFRYVFVSPVFHRWHHTRIDEGGLKNFANMFSCIDLAFGTWYLPPDLAPCHFGCDDSPIPENIAIQLARPVTRWRRAGD